MSGTRVIGLYKSCLLEASCHTDNPDWARRKRYEGKTWQLYLMQSRTDWTIPLLLQYPHPSPGKTASGTAVYPRGVGGRLRDDSCFSAGKQRMHRGRGPSSDPRSLPFYLSTLCFVFTRSFFPFRISPRRPFQQRNSDVSGF